GLYSEEICFRSDIEKTRIGISLNEEERETLFKSLKNLRNQLMFGDINAQIIVDNNGENLFFTPFKLELLKSYQSQDFKSFNDAVDKFFSQLDYDQLEKHDDKKIDRDLLKSEKVLASQEEYLIELKGKKGKFYTYGNYIYNNFNRFENLFSVILEAKSKGYSWEDINSKLELAKKDNYDDLEAFLKIVPTSRKLLIKIDSDEVSLDLTKSIGENANILYQKGKKIEKKINGTILAIQKSEAIIKKLKSKKENQIDDINFLVKSPKKKWYEKYRWFYTSDNFLVIAGRDASSNEAVYKKHISPNDLIFHTNFHGSPLAIIKNPKSEIIPETSKLETADFVASYSQAWKENWGVADIFYVFPDQISKTPPSGEYLPKGSFMISGKKNFIRDAKTELIIKLEFDEIKQDSDIVFYPRLIYGPSRALQKLKNPKLLLKPSKSGESKGKVAKKIKDYFYKSFDDRFKKWIELLSLDELIFIIPSGKTILSELD
ncbi:MAG: ribosome rescue protein RqcH, partial [Candidatus Hermodarchaeota archaeon]